MGCDFSPACWLLSSPDFGTDFAKTLSRVSSQSARGAKIVVRRFFYANRVVSYSKFTLAGRLESPLDLHVTRQPQPVPLALCRSSADSDTTEYRSWTGDGPSGRRRGRTSPRTVLALLRSDRDHDGAARCTAICPPSLPSNRMLHPLPCQVYLCCCPMQCQERLCCTTTGNNNPPNPNPNDVNNITAGVHRLGHPTRT